MQARIGIALFIFLNTAPQSTLFHWRWQCLAFGYDNQNNGHHQENSSEHDGWKSRFIEFLCGIFWVVRSLRKSRRCLCSLYVLFTGPDTRVT